MEATKQKKNWKRTGNGYTNGSYSAQRDGEQEQNSAWLLLDEAGEYIDDYATLKDCKLVAELLGQGFELRKINVALFAVKRGE